MNKSNQAEVFLYMIQECSNFGAFGTKITLPVSIGGSVLS